MTQRTTARSLQRAWPAGHPVRRALLLVLMIALAPVALLGLAQAIARERATAAAEATRLAETARLVADRQSEMLASATALLTAMKDNPALTGPGCEALLRGLVRRLPLIANLSMVDASGAIRCSALPVPADDPTGGQLAGFPWWRQLVEARGPMVRGPLHGTLSDRSVLWVLLPRRNPGDGFAGAVTASVDLAEIERRFVEAHGRGAAIAFIVDTAGRPVVSSRPLPWDRVPESPATGLQRLADAEGRAWRLALAPLRLPDPSAAALRSGYAIALPGPRDPGWWVARAAFLFPLAVLVVAVAGIWLGTQGIILRWIDQSRRLAGAYARGDWGASLAGFDQAPREFRDLAASLGRMARATQHRDRALLAALDRQRALSLELHHRVRNNLQMLSSYLAIAERDAPGPEGAAALAAARLRVAAVALMHRLLYDRGDLGTLPAAGLLRELCLLIERHGAGTPSYEGDAGAADLGLDIDTAVPLALWVIEAVDTLGGPGARGLRVRLRSDRPGRLDIRVQAAAGQAPAEPGPLLRAIARQLGARMSDQPTSHAYSMQFSLDRRDSRRLDTPAEQLRP